MINHDDIRVYRYGDKIKFVYYKYGYPEKKLSKDEQRVEWSDCYAYGTSSLLHWSGNYTVYDFIRSEDRAEEARKRIQLRKEREARYRSDKAPDEARFANSVSRSRSRVYELAMCNEFQFFCTFTLNADYKNRNDLKSFSKDFGQLIRNYNRCYEKSVKYLIVPERHKTGEWHAHGLLLGLSNDDFQINKYGYRDWRYYSSAFGFINIQDVDNRSAISAYITKYITKDLAMQALPAKAHLYYASQGLKRKEDITCEFDLESLRNLEFDFENDYVKILWLDC